MKGIRFRFILRVICLPVVLYLSGCTDPGSSDAAGDLRTPADGCMGKMLSCFTPSGSCEQDQNGIYFSNSANQIPDQPVYKNEVPVEYVSNQADTSMFCYRVRVSGIGKIIVTDDEGKAFYYLSQQKEGQIYPNSTTDQSDLLLNGNITVLCADNTEEYYTQGNVELLYGAGRSCNYVGSGPCTGNDYCNPNCAEGEDPDCESGGGGGPENCEITEIACNYIISGDHYMCVDENITFLDPDCDDIRCEDDGVCDPNCPSQDICDQSCVAGTFGDVTMCKDDPSLPSGVTCLNSALHPSCNNLTCGCDEECLPDPDCAE